MAGTVTYGAPAHRSGWTITEGIVLLIVGIIALGAPVAAAAATSLILPIVLLAEGVILIISAFGDRTFGRGVWHVLLGIVGLLAAFALFAQPIIAVASLPVILGLYLLVKGFVQVAIAATAGAEVTGRGWLWFSAAINILLAVLLFAQPFGASLLLTGLYIGISILMLGILLLALPKATPSEPMQAT